MERSGQPYVLGLSAVQTQDEAIAALAKVVISWPAIPTGSLRAALAVP